MDTDFWGARLLPGRKQRIRLRQKDYGGTSKEGTRKAAADFLKVPHRSFYDRVEKWTTRGKEYQRLYRFVEWRKKVGRAIMLPLGDSMQSGEPSDKGENPVTIDEVADKLEGADSRDYPTILREILEALARQNPKNWAEVRSEVVGIIREEIG